MLRLKALFATRLNIGQLLFLGEMERYENVTNTQDIDLFRCFIDIFVWFRFTNQYYLRKG